jgi:hypothetical protein
LSARETEREGEKDRRHCGVLLAAPFNFKSNYENEKNLLVPSNARDRNNMKKKHDQCRANIAALHIRNVIALIDFSIYKPAMLLTKQVLLFVAPCDCYRGQCWMMKP